MSFAGRRELFKTAGEKVRRRGSSSAAPGTLSRSVPHRPRPGAFQMGADAVPPAPLPPPQNGECSFNVAGEWSALVESGGFRLRAPAESTAGLVGPFRGVGDCLAPLLTTETLWIDPSMPAEEGDLVIVRWHADTLAGIIERTGQTEAGPFATKWLRAFGGQYWLVTATSMIPLGPSHWGSGADIVGVVRYIERAVRRTAAALAAATLAACINPDAATTVLTTTSASNSIANNTNDLVLSLSADPVGSDALVVLTAVCTGQLVRSSAGIARLYGKIINTNDSSAEENNSGSPQADSGTTNAYVDVEFSASGDKKTVLTLEKTYSVTAGDSLDFAFYVYGSNIDTGSGTLNNSFKMEVIKR